MAPKEKDNLQDKCGVVYQLTCHHCEASYIGETERALDTDTKNTKKTLLLLAIIWGIISTC